MIAISSAVRAATVRRPAIAKLMARGVAVLSGATSAEPFQPRTRFAAPSSVPRSYFLGHHRSGLAKMKSLLGSIDLIIECRDYRVPWTGRNPLFETELVGIGGSDTDALKAGGKHNVGSDFSGSVAKASKTSIGAVGAVKRIVVFTKWDLGGEGTRDEKTRQRDKLLQRMHKPTPVYFSSTAESATEGSRKSHGGGGASPTIRALLSSLGELFHSSYSMVGHRVLVAGMPNVGKSTLLNALRAAGSGATGRGKKVAATGAQPGITRRVSTGVRVIGSDDNAAASSAHGPGVYVLDTPGVFVPYVSSATAMLKLALVGSVKDTVVPPVTLADYLLFCINLRGDPEVYAEYSPPTNDVETLLDAVARRTGRLAKGAQPDTEGAALWFVQRWRKGLLGRFVLDDLVTQEDGTVVGVEDDEEMGSVSLSAARKMERERRRQASKAKFLNKKTGE